jgi:hypothetical protein
MKKIFIFCITSICLIGCVSAPYQLSDLSTPPEFEELGQSECRSCAFILFDFIPISHTGNVKDAFTCAVAKKNGDDLARPVVKTRWYYTPVGLVTCIDVSGEVIRKR